MNIAGLLEKQSRPVLIFLGCLGIVLVGVGDYFATSALLEFSVFFLVPISFFTWFVGRRAGIAACVVTGGIIAGVNLGSSLYLLEIRIAYWNALVWFAFFLLITFIIGDLKTLHLRERELARVDSLTGAATRLAFYEFAGKEINRARRFGQPMTLAYLDIDSFKEINDRNGHSTGDSVLKTVARCMISSLRRTDMVARMGGDEFALLLTNTDREAAGKLFEKLMNMLAKTMRQKNWPVTFSVGAVTFLNPPDSVDEMVERADEVMYSVKQSGKNRIQQEEVAA